MQGKPVPDFSLPSTGGSIFTLSHYPAFKRAGCEVLGISRHSVAPQEKFEAKMKFPFELLSDADEALCRRFGFNKLKRRYGKQVRGIERSTFAVDAKERLAREWRGVKVPGHVQEVLNFAKAL